MFFFSTSITTDTPQLFDRRHCDIYSTLIFSCHKTRHKENLGLLVLLPPYVTGIIVNKMIEVLTLQVIILYLSGSFGNSFAACVNKCDPFTVM